MTCETCGEKKPKNDSPSFTKATVEILNPKELALFRKVTVPASMGDDTANPPRVGKYCNVILYYEANNQAYIYSSDGIPTRITEDLTPILNKLKELDDEDKKIWEEIEEIEMSSDVVDIVGTYAELQQYDTSKLHDNDIIKVLSDETHDGEIAYYRWNDTTDTFSYVGSEGPYYTQTQIDTMMSGKQDTLIAGNNIQIAADGVTISATDTTYTAGTGINISAQNVISAKIIKTFYIDELSDGTKTLYHDSSKAQAVTVQEFIEAIDDPDVIVNIYDIDGDEQQVVIWGENSSAVVYSTYGDYFYKITAASSDQSSTSFTISHTEMQPKLTAGTNVQIDQLTNTISATDTTYTHFTGATSLADGVQGLVPGPLAGDQDKVLKGDGTWGEAAANTVFYADSSAIGSTRSIYKDAAMTTVASMQDIIDANEKGQVILRTTSTVDPNTYSDAYLQNAWVTSGDYQMLFLDEKKYSEYHATTASATTFNYESRELQDKLTAGTNVTITGTTISATDTTYSAFVGATSSVAGSAGLVPAPTTSDTGNYLKGDGTWAPVPATNNISSNDWSALWQ